MQFGEAALFCTINRATLQLCMVKNECFFISINVAANFLLAFDNKMSKTSEANKKRI